MPRPLLFVNAPRRWVIAAALLPFLLPVPSAEGQPIVVTANPPQGNVAQQMRQRGWLYDTEEQAEDPAQRLLLLLPDRLLLIELRATLEGEPFRRWRQAWLREMMARADADQDGRLTWEEALDSPQFLMGQFRSYRAPQVREQVRKSYDLNGDGEVQWEELQFLASQRTGGPTCVVTPGNAAAMSAAPLFELLDTDRNGELSAEEIASSAAHLKRRDFNDDELLSFTELFPAAVGMGAYQVSGGMNPAAPLLIPISPCAEYPPILEALRKKYGEPLPEGILRRLGATDDAALNADDLAQLRTAKPDIRIDAAFSDGADSRILRLEPVEEGEADPSAGRAERLELPLGGLLLEVSAANQPYGVANWERTVEGIFAQADRDKNGYLETEELKEGPYQAYLAQFPSWDGDGDGKVYREELANFYRNSQLPQTRKISIGAGDLGRSLLPLLDVDGDGSLSGPEIAAAPRHLLELDADGDGRLTAAEVPHRFRLGVARGPYVNILFSYAQRSAMQVNSPREPATDWFTAMDANRDGVVSAREFLGKPEHFKRLDTDGDGFLQPAEAASGANSP